MSPEILATELIKKYWLEGSSSRDGWLLTPTRVHPDRMDTTSEAACAPFNPREVKRNIGYVVVAIADRESDVEEGLIGGPVGYWMEVSFAIFTPEDRSDGALAYALSLREEIQRHFEDVVIKGTHGDLEGVVRLEQRPQQRPSETRNDSDFEESRDNYLLHTLSIYLRRQQLKRVGVGEQEIAL